MHLDILAGKAQHLPVGNPTEQVALGPIIDERQRDHHSLVTSSVAAGARLAAGGTLRSSESRQFWRTCPRAPGIRRRNLLSGCANHALRHTGSGGSDGSRHRYGLSLAIITRDVMKGLALAEEDPERVGAHQRPDDFRRGAGSAFGGVKGIRRGIAHWTARAASYRSVHRAPVGDASRPTGAVSFLDRLAIDALRRGSVRTAIDRLRTSAAHRPCVTPTEPIIPG